MHHLLIHGQHRNTVRIYAAQVSFNEDVSYDGGIFFDHTPRTKYPGDLLQESGGKNVHADLQ
jgi:hypothetical protein